MEIKVYLCARNEVRTRDTLPILSRESQQQLHCPCSVDRSSNLVYYFYAKYLQVFSVFFYLVLSRLPISEMFLDLSYLNIPITHNASSVRREILPVCFPVYLLCHLLCLNLLTLWNLLCVYQLGGQKLLM